MYHRFNRILACDGRTDRQTDGQSSFDGIIVPLCTASRSHNRDFRPISDFEIDDVECRLSVSHVPVLCQNG